jgi:hypothetical protein
VGCGVVVVIVQEEHTASILKVEVTSSLRGVIVQKTTNHGLKTFENRVL